MLSKEKVIEPLINLKSEFTIDELFEHICFIENVEIGLEDLKKGDSFNEIQLEHEISKWLK